mgnify:CR=1 FL=1
MFDKQKNSVLEYLCWPPVESLIGHSDDKEKDQIWMRTRTAEKRPTHLVVRFARSETTPETSVLYQGYFITNIG